MKGTLFVVSTPIGNLEDMTSRALSVLKEVDVVAAEDTRRTRKLMTHFGFSKRLISYWGEKEKAKAKEVIAALSEGLSVALVTDAGTPGIADPGAVLVRRACEEGYDVVPVPGPCAFVAALSVSGLPTEEFTFIGFLPGKRNSRLNRLKELYYEPRTLVFYESPHRLADTLMDMEEVLGVDRRMTVAKEITKLHEEFIRGTVTEVLDVLEEKTIAGEYVIIVEGKKKDRDDASIMEEALGEVSTLIKKGMGRKDAVKAVASEYGISKKELYDRSLGTE